MLWRPLAQLVCFESTLICLCRVRMCCKVLFHLHAIVTSNFELSTTLRNLLLATRSTSLTQVCLRLPGRLYFCLWMFVCQQDNSNNCQRICAKFLTALECLTSNSWINLVKIWIMLQIQEFFKAVCTILGQGQLYGFHWYTLRFSHTPFLTAIFRVNLG